MTDSPDLPSPEALVPERDRDIERLAAVPPQLTEALERRGFTELTSVQRAVLDAESEGRDLRISSQTGSGKTVAIGLALDVIYSASIGLLDWADAHRVLDCLRDLGFELYDPAPLHSLEHIHLAAEVAKRVFADRAEFLGDPDFVEVPVDRDRSVAHHREIQRAVGAALAEARAAGEIAE